MSGKRKKELTEEERAEQAAARKKRKQRRLRALKAGLIRLVLLAVLIYVLFFHIVGVTQMSSGDMYPRIDAGDLLLYYRLEKAPRAQDIIVFEKAVRSDLSPLREEENPAGDQEKKTASWSGLPGWVKDALKWLGFRDPADPKKTQFVSRVVAAPGDTVEITDAGQLVINGNAMIESGIFYPTTVYLGFTEYPLKLQPGEFFVMADFRNGGADSRFYGPVKEEEILGTVITVMRRNNL